ncbi:MAG TPA: GNAT family N-acetyltransferase [Myxococcaceae bacterium]|nr:GNAT family N-acetyltransferase [Myxococcaceae bacterium]
MLPFPTPPPTEEPVRIVLHEGGRRGLWPLFELADDSLLAICEYLDQGVVHVASRAGRAVGHSQVLQGEDGVCELRSLSVVPRHRRQGLGTRLVARSVSWVRDRSGSRLVTGIPSAKLELLGFYQRLGFRVLRVERDAYGPDLGYSVEHVANGIRVRDRVWLELEI